MKKFLFLSLLSGLLIVGLMSAPVFSDPRQDFTWRVGEELVYKVRWSFIRLGTIRLEVSDQVQIDDIPVYKVRFYLDSNPMLFFVNMHNIYETYIDENQRLHLFYANEKIDNITYYTEYRFNYTDSLIQIKMTDMSDTTKIVIKTLIMDNTILDGSSMVFYARAHSSLREQDTLISIYEAKLGKVFINFSGMKHKIKLVNAHEKEAYYVDGELFLKGIAGVTGPYKGWFSTDSQHVPLKAEMKVFIGSVVVELEAWKNWNGLNYPP